MSICNKIMIKHFEMILGQNVFILPLNMYFENIYIYIYIFSLLFFSTYNNNENNLNFLFK